MQIKGSTQRRRAVSMHDIRQIQSPRGAVTAAAHESVHGTKRTCQGRLTMSAPEGKTDVPREPGHFRF
jgi:hypothetical protein